VCELLVFPHLLNYSCALPFFLVEHLPIYGSWLCNCHYASPT
jgi:hypothetical protein